MNNLIDGQLKNTGRSLLEAEACQLWGMRGHVLFGKWSGVWLCLVGRKSLLMLRRRLRFSNLRHARPHTHTQNPIQAAQLCSRCGSLEEGWGALTRKGAKAWLGTDIYGCGGVKIILLTSLTIFTTLCEFSVLAFFMETVIKWLIFSHLEEVEQAVNKTDSSSPHETTNTQAC